MSADGPGPHDPKTCPGWYLALDGCIEGCVDCGLEDGDEAVWLRAHEFFQALPKASCGCCPGFAVFAQDVHRTPFEIERSDECGVFRDDASAMDAAVAACRAAGYWIVGGEDESYTTWRRA